MYSVLLPWNLIIKLATVAGGDQTKTQEKLSRCLPLRERDRERERETER